MIRSEKLDYIIKLVNEAFEVDINKKTRDRIFPYARSIYFTLAMQKTDYTLKTIGAHVGKDHATVLHGKKIFETIKRYEPEYLKIYYDLYDSFSFSPKVYKRIDTYDFFLALRNESENDLISLEKIKEILNTI
jgi:hypothetical protein